MTPLSKLILAIFAFVVIAIAPSTQKTESVGVQESVTIFRLEAPRFAASMSVLKKATSDIQNNNPESIASAIEALKEARLSYKRIEGFMEYFFVNSARIYNRAPKPEIEEPFLAYQEPMGLQVIEALLFEKDVFAHKKQLLDQTNILESSAKDLNSLLYQFEATDNQILESLRLDLIRIITLSLAGFDAPQLKSGIQESQASLEIIQKSLTPYLVKHSKSADSVTYYLNASILFLKQNPDFDSFDRLLFLTNSALPAQKYLGRMISELNRELNSYGVLNYKAENIFSPDIFDGRRFEVSTNTAEIALGKKLFSDPILSGNLKISCATCHASEHFFQDGLEKSIGFDGKTKVRRNSPTLLYASYQHTQFWDGRAKTLEDQINTVITDSLEMHGIPKDIVKKLAKRRSYRKAFRKAFTSEHAITEQHIYQALASFVSTLHPFNSDFDRYLRGNQNALSPSQIRGFNIFMGKAQCGTCHFIPLFNGLIPPTYALTEFEVLGTPASQDLSKPMDDKDKGRVEVKSIQYYKGAFKTPTVRNSERTAPYMHNGAFASLDSLIEFYNKGGGVGLGLNIPYQTLSANPLNLSANEKLDLINFIKALTDKSEGL